LEVAFEVVRTGSTLTLTLRGAHIQCARLGEVGLKELRDLARQYGREQGAKQMVIEGARPYHRSNAGQDFESLGVGCRAKLTRDLHLKLSHPGRQIMAYLWFSCRPLYSPDV